MAASRAPRPAAPAAAARLLGVLWLVSAAAGEDALKCEDLRVGQYLCKDPKINDATQEPVNCTNYTAHVPCFPAPNITCKDFGGNETHFTGREVGFFKPISCRNVNGYSYKVAVALSLFLGWLGADRFYLGYPALGLLKFCTVGFCGIGSLIDFILISMQDSSIREGDGFITTDVTKQRSGSIWSSQCLPPASQRVFRSPPESLFLLLQYFRASVLSA
ncbi:TM2 domain-containing protein 1 isoform X2 [Equus przewalskii]|uniref:TM2 domain-containing protein 1 isoform X2 n=1 Tax=Equus przewalskii TaxID=9798 RepID=A0ABM4M6K1_EQUPR